MQCRMKLTRRAEDCRCGDNAGTAILAAQIHSEEIPNLQWHCPCNNGKQGVTEVPPLGGPSHLRHPSCWLASVRSSTHGLGSTTKKEARENAAYTIGLSARPRISQMVRACHAPQQCARSGKRRLQEAECATGSALAQEVRGK